MKKSLYVLVIFLIMFLSFPVKNIKTSENDSKSYYVKDHIIVKLKKEIITAASFQNNLQSTENIAKISADLGIKVKRFKPLFAFGKNTIPALYSKYELNEYFIVSLDDERD